VHDATRRRDETQHLKKKLADGVPVVGGWAGIPNAFSTEIYAAQGWDSVTIDMQHGAPTMNDLVSMLQAVVRQRRHSAGARAVERSLLHHARARCGAMGLICR
jgi:4-hydroxy-2-oxoheptanedioate aldolase